MFENYMKECFELAKKGLGKTSPNPIVGCVVLDKNGNKISTGYHAKYGNNHAERDAILKLQNGEEKDGTVIVNLEPCSHYGKTPPCVDLIIERGIKRVVFAMKDPNPLVSSIKKLEDNGIEVIYGILEKEAKDLNEVFITNMLEKRPFVALKTATTIDGKISTKTGNSKWITSDTARNRGKELREIYDAVLTTSSTVIADNPKFDNDLKILIDRNLKVDLEKIFFKTGKIIIVHDKNLKPKKNIDNIEYLPCSVKNERIDINELLNMLFERKIMSIFIEAGGKFNGSMIETGFVDKIYHFVAPKILGDNNGKSAFDGRDITDIQNCINYNVQDIEQFEKDILITYKKAND